MTVRTRRTACPSAVLLLAAVFLAEHVAADLRLDAPEPSVRRRAVIGQARRGPEAMPALARALKDSDMLVRRAAVNGMRRLDAAALPGLRQALRNEDMLVRRNAAMSLGQFGIEAMPLMQQALRDRDPLVRQAAVVAMLAVRPRSAQILATLREVSDDPDPNVRAAVVTALQDYLIVTWEMRLPTDGWKFMKDPDGVGQAARWYAPDFDDGGWSSIGTEMAWGSFGHQGYIGNGWYRRTIELPETPGPDGVFMRFGGVDECARVWVNGTFVGEHDIGPTGWDKPFQLDVTNAIRWGEDNQITVLAWNTAHAGGIWQPIHLLAATRPE